MSQISRSASMEGRKDDDLDDAVNNSWDVESRYRLQEKALKLQHDQHQTDSMFRLQVELGLHELTAAMSSLSRRIDKLEENVTLPEKENQDEAVKALARNARCISQALPGIASARTRRRALHGYFRENDEQRSDCGDRIDPAARALIVECLTFLAGKVRLDAALEGKADTGGLGLRSGGKSSVRDSSPSSPSRRRARNRSKNGSGGGMWKEEDEKQFDDEPDNNARNGGDADGGSPRGLGFSSGSLEVGHFRGRGSSIPSSPIKIAGSVDGNVYPSNFLPGREQKSRSRATNGRGLRADLKLVGSSSGPCRRQQKPSADEDNESITTTHVGSTSLALGVAPAGGRPFTPIRPDAATVGSMNLVTKAATKDADAGEGGNSNIGGDVDTSAEKKTGAGASCVDIATDHSGRANLQSPEIPDFSSPRIKAEAERTAEFSGSRSKNRSGKAHNTDCISSPDVQLLTSAHGGATDDAGPPGDINFVSVRDLLADTLLHTTEAAVDTDERSDGLRNREEEHRLGGKSVRVDRDDVGVGVDGGNGYGSGVRGGQEATVCQAEIEAVRALSIHVRQASSLVPSSSSSSCSSVAAVVSRKSSTVTSKRHTPTYGGKAAAEERLDCSTEPIMNGSFGAAKVQQSSRNCDVDRKDGINGHTWSSLRASADGPVTDAQGFLDLGAATVGEKRPEEGVGRNRSHRDPDPRVAELEEKLKELKMIGERIKEESAQVASTTEPSLTIPDQHLTGFDLLPHRPRSGYNTPLGSRHPSSSARQQQLDHVLLAGRTRGNQSANAHSAFTLSETSSTRTAEDLSPVAEVPTRPCDHPSTEPALSQLLAPPFSNAALRGDFIASLRRHLAEYEDHEKDEAEADKDKDAIGAYKRDTHNEGNQRDAADWKRGEKIDDGTARCTSNGGDDRVTTKTNEEDSSDCEVDESRLATTTTVREPPTGPRVIESRSLPVVEPGPALEPPLVGRLDRPEATRVRDTDISPAQVEGATGDEVEAGARSQEKERKSTVTVGEDNHHKERDNRSSTWAQEYHDYLCSKYG